MIFFPCDDFYYLVKRVKFIIYLIKNAHVNFPRVIDRVTVLFSIGLKNSADKG